MVNAGSYAVRTASDNWTVLTSDGSPSAHFEHTILVVNDSPEILTVC
jgi:methionyl aminopeptidase